MKAFLTALFTVLCLSASTQTLHTQEIYFDTGKSSPAADLTEIGAILSGYAESGGILFIRIVGHTDGAGDERSNLDLSQRRARTVWSYLKNQNLTENLSYEGFGEMQARSEAANASERKVSIVYAVNENVYDETADARSNPEGETDAQEIQEAQISYRMWDPNVEVPDQWIFPLKPGEQVLPESALPPVEGCRAFFTGALISDTYEQYWTSEAWVEDEFSEYLGAGKYHDLHEALPKAVFSTFDGIAIGAGTRVIVYEKQNFKGKVVLDITGPAMINNNIHIISKPELATKKFKEDLQKLFPQENRHWSETSMYSWQDGSLKIECGSKPTAGN